jgi:hypothetical protein
MAPKTTDEIARLLVQIERTTQDTNSFFAKVSDLMAEICTEALDSTKIIGNVGYAGSPLIDKWAEKDGCYPFHIKDKITNKMVPDPRVILIGKALDHVGKEYYRDGMMAMREVYILTGQRVHTFMRPLDYAWHGIGLWAS